MGRIAYTIAGAAKTASVTEEIIVAAVKDHKLIARRIEGKRAVILGTDIQAWLEGRPSYLD
jgi:hypothetical protein